MVVHTSDCEKQGPALNVSFICFASTLTIITDTSGTSKISSQMKTTCAILCPSLDQSVPSLIFPVVLAFTSLDMADTSDAANGTPVPRPRNAMTTSLANDIPNWFDTFVDSSCVMWSKIPL